MGEQPVGDKRDKKALLGGQWMRRKSKDNGAELGLEKLQVIRGLFYGGDGSVVVDLPNLSTQHVFILTELCFHCPSLFGLEIYRNILLLSNISCYFWEQPQY